MAERISIQELQPGMVIMKITAQYGPVRIRKSGLVTSVEMVKGLAEMGVQEVEIDPEQTVEIDSGEPVLTPSTHSVSATRTQSLMAGGMAAGKAKQSQVQNQAGSEHFQRNLFLSTLQDMPSAWQMYGKNWLLALVCLSAGLVLGWGGASAGKWLMAPAELAAVAAGDNAIVKEQVAGDTSTVSAGANQASSNKLLTAPAESTSPASATSVQQPEPASASVAQPQSQERQPNVAFTDRKEDRPLYSGDSNDSSSVSPDLLAKFNQALAEMEKEGKPVSQPEPVTRRDVQRLDQLPAFVLTQLPPMSFSAHMYASEPKNRWVRVNDVEHAEGDIIAPGVKLLAIDPQQVILEFQQQRFSMSALSEW